MTLCVCETAEFLSEAMFVKLPPPPKLPRLCCRVATDGLWDCLELAPLGAARIPPALKLLLFVVLLLVLWFFGRLEEDLNMGGKGRILLLLSCIIIFLI